MKRALITIATVGLLAPTAWVAGANAQYGAPAPAYGPAPAYAPGPAYGPCAGLWPFSKICPSSLPSHCSSDLWRSDLSRRSPCGLCRWYGLHPWLWWAALRRSSSNICRTICPTE